MTTTIVLHVTHWVNRRKSAVRDEAGAVLILALVFLVAVSGLVLALAGSTSNDLLNTVNFSKSRTVDTATTNAVQVAIQSIRYTPILESGGIPHHAQRQPTYLLLGFERSVDFSGIDVWCSSAWTPASANSRVVTLSACPTEVTTDAATCAAHPLLQEVVTFDDYPAGVSAPNTGQCAVYCGTGVTVNSLTWSPTVPTVTSIAPAAGPMTGGTSVTITGTGFVSGATTVNFVDTRAIDNAVVAATNVTVTSPTTITAVSPGIIVGTSYYATVTTPGGTSATSPASTFAYSTVKPVVTSVTPNSGQVQHGTAVTIAGSGFFSGATVTFVKVSGGTPLPATAVNVVNSSKITAISYPVATAGTYYVVVTTPYGTSANSQTFTFS